MRRNLRPWLVPHWHSSRRRLRFVRDAFHSWLHQRSGHGGGTEPGQRPWSSGRKARRREPGQVPGWLRCSRAVAGPWHRQGRATTTSRLSCTVHSREHGHRRRKRTTTSDGTCTRTGTRTRTRTGTQCRRGCSLRQRHCAHKRAKPRLGGFHDARGALQRRRRPRWRHAGQHSSRRRHVQHASQRVELQRIGDGDPRVRGHARHDLRGRGLRQNSQQLPGRRHDVVAAAAAASGGRCRPQHGPQRGRDDVITLHAAAVGRPLPVIRVVRQPRQR